VNNGSFTVLAFVLPVFKLPGEFANFTDPSLEFPFNNASSNSRRRRSLTGEEEHHTVSTAVTGIGKGKCIYIAPLL